MFRRTGSAALAVFALAAASPTQIYRHSSGEYHRTKAVKVLFFILILLAWWPAKANILRLDTSCSTVITIMDGDDRQQIGYAVQFLADALNDADRSFLEKRRGSIMQPLTEEGLTGVVAMTIARCRRDPTLLARTATKNLYDQLRTMQSAAGLVR